MKATEIKCKEVKGINLVSLRIHYENITVSDDKGNVYFISPQQLLVALSEFNFHAERKRTRFHLITCLSE